MTAMHYLIVLAGLAVLDLIWLVHMIVGGRLRKNPPRHAEDTWTVDNLPSHPYATDR